MMATTILLWIACVVSLTSAFLVLHDNRRNVLKTLSVDNGAVWGDWHAPAFCAEGSYAVGYYMKRESNQHDRDDTALNSVLLRCESLDERKFGGEIESGEGSYGTWTGLTRCDNRNQSHHFITSFQLQVEGDTHGGDDTAANYIKFHCRDFASSSQGYELAYGNGYGLFGNFGQWSDSCPPNSAVCGIQARVEDVQGGGDDTSLNNIKLFCCGKD